MRFHPPIVFPVFIEGKPATASVLDRSDEPLQPIFRVAFSNGFIDEFMLEDDGNVYGSGIAAIHYAKAIRFDIGHLAKLDPTRFYFHFPETIDGMKTNIWVMEEYDRHMGSVYKVYYFEFFRFALRWRKETWELVQSLVPAREPDGRLVDKTGFLLQNLLARSNQ